MNTKNTRTTILLIALGLLMLFATACSPSKAEKINQEGNDAFAEQAYQEAMALYQSAQIEDPELAEPYYNSANALYRQGEYEAALQQLQMALTFAEDETLAQSSLFNLGNSSFNAQDSGTAVAAYTEALLLNPDDQDAKYNLELALQQQEQQEQEQEQEQEEQEQEEEQESEGGEGEEEQENQDQGEGEEEQQEGQEGEQEQEGDQSEQEGDQQDESQEEGEEQQDGQPQDGEDQEGEDGEPQDGQGQPDAPGEPGAEDPNGQEQPSYVPQPGERMTQEQAEQLLAAIAQDSETLQEKLGQIWSVPWRPPVQDW